MNINGQKQYNIDYNYTASGSKENILYPGRTNPVTYVCDSNGVVRHDFFQYSGHENSSVDI